MPHVKLSGNLSLKDLWADPPAFEFSIPDEGCHFKFVEAFLGASGTACLYRYVVAEGRLAQHVQVLLAQDGDGWILKLDRTYPILRTPGLKLLLGMVTRWLERRGAAVDKSNIGPYLARGAFYADHPPSPEPGSPETDIDLTDPLLEPSAQDATH
jgi:hypothetical protein